MLGIEPRTQHSLTELHPPWGSNPNPGLHLILTLDPSNSCRSCEVFLICSDQNPANLWLRDRSDGLPGFTDTHWVKAGPVQRSHRKKVVWLVQSHCFHITWMARINMSQLPMAHTEPGCTSKRDASAKVLLESCRPCGCCVDTYRLPRHHCRPCTYF